MNSRLFLLKTLAAAFVLTSGLDAKAQISEFPYETTAYNSAPKWTSAGTKKWSVGSSYCETSIGSGLNDAWLFSPSITLTAGYAYVFSFKVEATKSQYPVSIVDTYILDGNTSSAGKLFTNAQIVTSADNMVVDGKFEFAPKTDMTVYFAVHDVTNGSDKGWYTRFSGFSIVRYALEKKAAARWKP